MIPGSINALLLGEEAAAGGYTISRSLRFNSADSAYLSRTPASAGNRKTWTWAGWVKRSGLGSRQNVFGTADASFYNGLWLEFFSDDTVRLGDIGASALDLELRTSQVFRDPSSWGHLVIAIDTTQSTASSRIKFYWNGIQITAFSTSTYPTQNFDTRLNTASAHGIGRAGSYNAQYFNGYLADIHFIDGQALDPTSFGEFSATTGVWMPKAYTGSYGTNGFKLDFSDNSAATATTLGKDAAGSNNWTPNNLSVTAGAGNDSLVDVPVNGSETDTGAGGQVRGNYCTWNPLEKAANATLSNGNLDITQASGDQNTGGTIAVSSGKWYWEVTFASGTESRIGAIKQQFVKTDSPFATFLGGGANGYSYANGGYKSNNNNNSATGYSTYTTNDVISVALDLDNGRIFFAKNGTWQESGNPATGSNPAYTGLSGAFTPAVYTPNATLNANFGQRPFAYTAPSGFKALCTANLPAPTIVKPSTVMDVLLWTGTSTSSARTLSGLNHSPDFIWAKNRSGAGYSHNLYDSNRGVGKMLVSNGTDSEYTNNQFGYISAFNSDGFSTTPGSTNNSFFNELNASYVAWCWDAGSSTVTNTAGSISSQVRANASAGFSVVTYTGAGSTSSTVGHGLGVAPSFIIAKARTTASQVNSWRCYHRSLGATQYIELSSTAAAGTFTDWANTAPTSSAFYVGGTNTTFPVNENGISYVAYCFAPVAGYSAFGSYTGNGSASDGPFVYTGFRPRWILLKDSTNAGSWELIDTARIGYNGANYRLFPNLSDAEFADHRVDILSNGFKLRVGAGSAINSSNAVIVYAAFSEVAFNFARAR